jgi:DNA-binding transcriptional regulator GbsR (MarR family)
MNILIKFPTRGRPDKFFKTLDAYVSFANDISKILFYISCDIDDDLMNNKNIIEKLKSYKNLQFSFNDNKTKIEAINSNLNIINYNYDIILLASDDMIPQIQGYDDVIRDNMIKYYPDTDGVLWFNDSLQGKNLNTLCILGREYFNRFKYLYHPAYKSFYCDNEFTIESKKLNKVQYFDDVIIKHEHPDVNPDINDHIYDSNNKYYGEDRSTFERRLTNDFKRKIIGISFATESFDKIQDKLNESLQNSECTEIIKYREYNLPEEFLEKYSNILKSTRGYGYWCWKPNIILECMNRIDYGDVVIYVDSANILINSLNYIVEKSKTSDIILFDNRDGNNTGECWLNDKWTKRDCFKILNCDDPIYWKGKQINASYQVYTKTKFSMQFLNEYASYCLDVNAISDEPNIYGDNLESFVDHRHDQSIASLLAIKYNIELLPDPSEWGNHLNRPYPQLFWHCRGLL